MIFNDTHDLTIIYIIIMDFGVGKELERIRNNWAKNEKK